MSEPLIKKIIREIDVSDFDPSPYTDPNVIRPLPAQEKFLLSHKNATITFYGGSAGSAKTVGLLYDVFQHCEDPNFDGIVFRKNSTQLRGAGGIFTKATELYKKIGAEVKDSRMVIKFPKGATMRYSYMEHDSDVYNHQGLEYSAQYWDELGHFSKNQFMYMISRLRSNAKNPSFIKCSMNPEPDSWILDFVGWYLTPDGYADYSKSGKVRWFITDEDGKMAWADDPDELKALYGNDVDPISFTFIAASIADNPVLCKMNPNYLSALKNLNRVDREILLYGNWFAVPESSGYFKRDWVDFVEPKDVPKLKKVIRSWDFASSLESEANTDPDFSACVKIGLGEDGYFYVLHADHFRDRPAGVLSKVLSYCELDGKNCPVGIPLDPGQAGRVAFEVYAKPLVQAGYAVKKMKTRKGKVERFLPFSNAAENNLVRIVKGNWNRDFIKELEAFDGESRRRKFDDIVDACSDSYNWLISGKKLPDKFRFNPASITKINEMLF